MKPKVVNLKNNPTGAVRIDRGSRWGNPFILGCDVDGSRKEVIDLYTRYAKWRLTIQPDWLKPLRGKDLACWCAPLPCHGDVLLELLKEKR